MFIHLDFTSVFFRESFPTISPPALQRFLYSEASSLPGDAGYIIAYRLFSFRARGSSLKRQNQQPKEEHLLHLLCWDETEAAFCRRGPSLNPCAMVILLLGRLRGVRRATQRASASYPEHTVSFMSSFPQGHSWGS